MPPARTPGAPAAGEARADPLEPWTLLTAITIPTLRTPHDRAPVPLVECAAVSETGHPDGSERSRDKQERCPTPNDRPDAKCARAIVRGPVGATGAIPCSARRRHHAAEVIHHDHGRVR